MIQYLENKDSSLVDILDTGCACFHRERNKRSKALFAKKQKIAHKNVQKVFLEITHKKPKAVQKKGFKNNLQRVILKMVYPLPNFKLNFLKPKKKVVDNFNVSQN